MSYKVMTDSAHLGKRHHLLIWSDTSYPRLDAEGWSLPDWDGYQITTHSGDQVTVACPCPRDGHNYLEVDSAIDAALRAHYA